MTQWKKLLHSLGLSDSEATIYLASLELGPASVQDIAKKSHVSRVTTYAVIESLTERSLMSSVEKGKKHLFAAESPERLVAFVTARLKEMETTLHEVQGAIDELKLIQRGEKPVVKMYEGSEALKAIETDILMTKPKTIEEFTNLDAIRTIHPPETREAYFEQFAKLKPKSRAILLARGKPPQPVSADSDQIVIPRDLDLDFKGSLMTYGQKKVALCTLEGKLIAVVVESEALAKTVHALFDYIWYLKNK
jgi:sugar-specific transcriptional regulator TrmB